GRHLLRLEIHVEERAHLPRAVAQQSTLALQPRVERCPGEGSLHGDLNVKELGLHGKLEDPVEDLRALAIEPQDEAPIDANPARLDAPDRFSRILPSLSLPVALQLQAVQAPLARALEADQYLRAAASAHQPEQLGILVD